MSYADREGHSKSSGFVYAMGCLTHIDTGVRIVKIGFSKTPESRVKSIRSAMRRVNTFKGQDELKLLFVGTGSTADEFDLHKAFNRHRVELPHFVVGYTEWYYMSGCVYLWVNHQASLANSHRIAA